MLYTQRYRYRKLDAKNEEGIFMGYPTKSKAYKCLNSNTNKVVESANVKVDAFIERSDITYNDETEDYSIFIYMDDGAPSTPNEQENQVAVSQHT